MPPLSLTFSGETLTDLQDAAREFLRLDQRIGQAAAAADEAAPAAPKAASRSRRAPEVQTAPVAAPVAAPAAEAPAKTPPQDDLKKVAIARLVTLINANDALGRNGKQVCTDLCLKFGGSNISKIDAAKYPAVIAEVEKALEALNSDPAA